MRKTALAPGQLLRSDGEKLPRQRGLPGVVHREPASRSCPGATKNSCEQLQVSDRAPRQS